MFIVQWKPILIAETSETRMVAGGTTKLANALFIKAIYKDIEFYFQWRAIDEFTFWYFYCR